MQNPLRLIRDSVAFLRYAYREYQNYEPPEAWTEWRDQVGLENEFLRDLDVGHHSPADELAVARRMAEFCSDGQTGHVYPRLARRRGYFQNETPVSQWCVSTKKICARKLQDFYEDRPLDADRERQQQASVAGRSTPAPAAVDNNKDDEYYFLGGKDYQPSPPEPLHVHVLIPREVPSVENGCLERETWASLLFFYSKISTHGLLINPAVLESS
jgi:hypothetical protein